MEKPSGRRRFTFLLRSRTSLRKDAPTTLPPIPAGDSDTESGEVVEAAGVPENSLSTNESEIMTRETKTTVITIKDEESRNSDDSELGIVEDSTETTDTINSSETGNTMSKIHVSNDGSLPSTSPLFSEPSAQLSDPPNDPPSRELIDSDRRKNKLSASQRIRNTLAYASRKRGPSKKDIEKSLERCKAAYASMRRIEDYTEFFQTRQEVAETPEILRPRRGSEAYSTFSYGQSSVGNRQYGSGMTFSSSGMSSSTFKTQPQSIVYGPSRPPPSGTSQPTRGNFRLNESFYGAGSALSLASNCVFTDAEAETLRLSTAPPSGGLLFEEEEYFSGTPIQLSRQLSASRSVMPKNKASPGNTYTGDHPRRPMSPFYEMPEEEKNRFTGGGKSAGNQEDKFRFRRGRNPLYSSMPKLNGNDWNERSRIDPWLEVDASKLRPAASWGHLGPSERMFSAYNNHFAAPCNSDSLHRQYQYQQNSPVFRNIFPYTTLYGRGRTCTPAQRYPTIPVHPQPSLDEQYGRRRFPTAYKRYYSQSARRPKMNGGGTSSLRFTANRKTQPRVYELFADESALESDVSIAGRPPPSIKSSTARMPPNHPSSVFFVPEQATMWQIPAAPVPGPHRPPSFGSSASAELEETLRRRKRANRNCMVGWMLGLTAMIILALAIALFIQGKD